MPVESVILKKLGISDLQVAKAIKMFIIKLKL